MNLSPTPVFKGFDNNGRPLVGGKLFTYVAGTSVKQATYTSSDGSQTNSNPIILDYRGEARVWLDPDLTYKFVLSDRDDSDPPTRPIWSVDNIPGGVTLTQGAFDALLALSPPFKRTSTEILDSITPSDYFYTPDHVGYDVRRTGALGNGAADDGVAIASAQTIGNSIYLPQGVFRVASDLVIAVPVLFENGAVLKPDVGVTITINAAVLAGPWRIFNVTNAGSLITGLLGNRCAYPEWFGAIGDGVTDDTIAIQAALKIAKDAGCIDVCLQSKDYRISATLHGNGADVQQFEAPSLIGVEPRRSRILHPALEPALKYRGGSGQFSRARVNAVGFLSDTAGTGWHMEFSGKNGMSAENCLFDVGGVGVYMHNDDVGSFTEYCVVKNSEFQVGCKSPLQYKVTSGNPSFHGSGLMHCQVVTDGSFPVVLIDTGASVYNAPMDLQVWANASATIILNSSTFRHSLYGTMTVEIFAGTVTLCTASLGQDIPYAGKFITLGTPLNLGRLYFCTAVAHLADGGRQTIGGEYAIDVPVVSSSTTIPLPYRFSESGVDFLVTIVGASYFFRYRVVSGGASSTPNVGTAMLANNTSGWGPPTFSCDSNGDLQVTNGSYPTNSTVVISAEVKQLGQSFNSPRMHAG